jgi:hypothetical protein
VSVATRRSTGLVGVQRRLALVGRLRYGEAVPNKDPKKRSYPRALSKWRLTSASQELLEAAREIYGGKVRPWEGAPDEGFFELYTDSAELDVVLPPVYSAEDGTPTYPYMQAFELWQGATLERRCDGETATLPKGRSLADHPCVCRAAGLEPGRDKTACAVVTRVTVMLPRLPGLGVWRMDSHGWTVATQLPGTLDLLSRAAAQRRFVPATLRLEQRSRKVRGDDGKVETNRFIVPVLDLGVTPAQLMAAIGADTWNVPQLPASKPELLAGPAPAEGGHTRPQPEWGEEAPLDEQAPVNEQPGEGERAIAGRDPEPATTPPPADGDPWMRAIHAIGREKGLDHDGIRLVAAGFFGEAVFPADRSLTDLNPLERGRLRKALDDMKPAEQAAGGLATPAAVDASGKGPDAGASGAGDSLAPDSPIERVAPAASPPGSPAPPDTADPDPAVEAAVWGAAVAHGIVAADAGVAGWEAIDAIAEKVFNKDRSVILRSELTELAAQIAAGIHDPTPARPRRTSAPKEST